MKRYTKKFTIRSRNIPLLNLQYIRFLMGIGVCLFSMFDGTKLYALGNLLVPPSLGARTESTRASQNVEIKNEQIIAALSRSFDPQLQKLARYKKSIPGDYGNEMMIFLHIPTSRLSAQRLALNMNNLIREYQKHRVQPVFLFEPFDEFRREIAFKDLKNGTYSDALESLFYELKYTHALSYKDIGLLVPYPEFNTPAYKRDGFEPSDFAILINQFFRSARIHFPQIEGGILLDSKSYDAKKKWGEGTHTSFMPYLRGIAPGTIQRLGIQGFPWVNENASIRAYNPAVYLPYALTLEAAKYLSVQSIWFHTGVMRKKYRSNTITLSPEVNNQILRDTLFQAKRLKAKGYDISVSLFAQNKFQYIEATDWGFLGDEKYEKVVKGFFLSAKQGGISVSLYDK